MSKIGKKPINIPENVQVEIGQKVLVKGPLGELSFKFHHSIKIGQEENRILVTAKNEDRHTKAYHVLTRSLISNMIVGVSEGYKKSLELSGIDVKSNLTGYILILSIGYSHPVEITAPEGIKFEVSENKITISGIKKELVGKIAAEIRLKRPPDAYKGKGIRYVGEVVRLKPGKAAKTASGTA